jgi:hypothetical protein
MASSLAQRRVADRRDPDGRDRVAWLRRQRLVETRRSHAGDNLHHRAVGKNEDRFRHRQPLDLRQRQCPSHGRGDPGRGAAHDRSFLHVGPIALGSQCDPSYTLKAGTEGETGFITSLANAGDTVLMADYEGEDAAYGVGQLSGYQKPQPTPPTSTSSASPKAEYRSTCFTTSPHQPPQLSLDGADPLLPGRPRPRLRHTRSVQVLHARRHQGRHRRSDPVFGHLHRHDDQADVQAALPGHRKHPSLRPHLRSKHHEPKRNPTRATVHREWPLGLDRRRRHRHKGRPVARVHLLSPGRRGRARRLQGAQPLRSRHSVLCAGANIPSPAIQESTLPQSLRQYRPRQLRRLGTGTRVLTNTAGRSIRSPAALVIGSGQGRREENGQAAMPPGPSAPTDPTALKQNATVRCTFLRFMRSSSCGRSRCICT